MEIICRQDFLWRIRNRLAHLLAGGEPIRGGPAADRKKKGRLRVGEFFDELDATGTVGRRQLLDDAREAVGLESTTEIDNRRAAPPPASPHTSIRGLDAGGELRGCSAASCKALPMDQSGQVVLVPNRQWWCPQHERLAEPGDELPDEDGAAVLDANFRLIPSLREQRQLAAQEAHERAERERQAEEKRAEREALRKIKHRWGETADPVDIAGYKVRPGGRVVDE